VDVDAVEEATAGEEAVEADEAECSICEIFGVNAAASSSPAEAVLNEPSNRFRTFFFSIPSGENSRTVWVGPNVTDGAVRRAGGERLGGVNGEEDAVGVDGVTAGAREASTARSSAPLRTSRRAPARHDIGAAGEVVTGSSCACNITNSLSDA